jgi:GalNAc-alpha-(1->4)-GalNAc-alpha-(1->3)-diNAcBac-PP-undecaprenol alpha-1,4-N-acetyl-D-galactosaminyltransferase
MKIIFTYRAIDGIAGGAEKMSVALMNHLVNQNHQVHFLTFDKQDASSFYKMDRKITWHKINIGDYNKKAQFSVRLKRVLAARKIIYKVRPDIIIAFQHGSLINTVIFNAFLGFPIIWAERVAPQYFDYVNNPLFKFSVYQFARFAQKITVQCASFVSEYPNHLRHKIEVISNPVFPASERASPHGGSFGEKIILCVGRIDFQKNQKLLVEVFLELSGEFPNWTLVLAGDGDDKNDVANMVGNSTKIKLLGNVKNTDSLYKNAHLFCLPSRWEGFPNALAEALSSGLPAVGFSDCSGVCDLIKHEKNGLLAEGNENKFSLKDSLRTLMLNNELREKYGEFAIESVAEYAPSIQFEKWELLFKETQNVGK